ncbi:adenylate kinase [bacterium BRH_c32]|nr:MAG: adenylate kinase [bacterium BRH_c32]
MNLIIFGAPGVGKGTQAKIISEKLSIAHISTGDILREAVKNKTELGSKAKAIMDMGELVPDEIVAGIVKDTLNSNKCSTGFILDGFPRTLPQAQLLKIIFDELEIKDIKLIKLDAEDQVMINRLSSRRVCSSCGKIISKDEVYEGVKCSVCGETNSFIKRSDDDEDVIKKRLSVYHNTTSPVFDYYHDKVTIIEIDGTQPVEDVTNDILEKLNLN